MSPHAGTGTLVPAAVLESLEPRLAPAGIVAISTAGGHLTVTGDADDNAIEINAQPGGFWEITGEGTLFKLNGGLPAESLLIKAPTGNVTINLHGGADAVSMINTAVRGGLRVGTHAGNDYLQFTGSVQGAVQVDTAGGDDSIEMTGSFKSAVNVFTGAGSDSLEVRGGFFGKGITASLGDGSNSFLLADGGSQEQHTLLTIRGNVNIGAVGGLAEQQRFGIQVSNPCIIAGHVSAYTVKGSTEFQVQSGSDQALVIDRGLSLRSAGDNDTLLIWNADIAGQVKVDFTQSTSGRFEAGGDRTVRIGSLLYLGGRSFDVAGISSALFYVRDQVVFQGGQGDNSLYADAGSMFIGGSLTFNGGGGSDQVSLLPGTLLIGGDLRFQAGRGADELRIETAHASLRSLHFQSANTGGAEMGSLVSLSGLRTSGDVSARLGTGFSSFTLNASEVGGSVSVQSTSSFADGEEQFRLSEVTIEGALTLAGAGSTNRLVSLDHVSAGRAVSIMTGSGHDIVELDGTSNETGLGSFFHGGISISLGAGDDLFSAGADAGPGSYFAHHLRVDGGAGADEARLTPESGNTFAPGLARSVVRVEAMA